MMHELQSGRDQEGIHNDSLLIRYFLYGNFHA